MIKYFLLVFNNYWLSIHLQREENIISNRSGFLWGGWITVRSSVGHWHQSNDYSFRVPAQHSHTAAQPGDMHDTTNYRLCCRHESLSYEKECPSSSPYSSSASATLFFLRTRQTALPYSWVSPLTTWKVAAYQVLDLEDTAQSPLFLNHKHSSPAT